MTTVRRSLPFVAIGLLAAVGGLACGGDDDDAADGLTGEAARGRQLVEDVGCQSCHRAGGGVGPSWDGLYGSTVELDDGTTVVADEAYLTRSIVDPGAEKVDGYAVDMPDYPSLDDDDIAAIVAYIRTLGEPGAAMATAP